MALIIEHMCDQPGHTCDQPGHMLTWTYVCLRVYWNLEKKQNCRKFKIEWTYVEEKATCKPFILSEIDLSVTPCLAGDC